MWTENGDKTSTKWNKRLQGPKYGNKEAESRERIFYHSVIVIMFSVERLIAPPSFTYHDRWIMAKTNPVSLPCYYDELDIEKDATNTDIKKA